MNIFAIRRNLTEMLADVMQTESLALISADYVERKSCHEFIQATQVSKNLWQGQHSTLLNLDFKS